MNRYASISLAVVIIAFAVIGGSFISYAEDSKALSGKVIETMDSGGYTYAQIENSGKKIWVAVPKTKIEKGQDITFAPGTEMPNFESKSLNRTFESVIFSSGVVGNQGESEMKSAGSAGNAVIASEKIQIEKAAGPDSYTVAELLQNSGKLEEKRVVVRGKVVKVSPGIMKRNWIHLQDGTGEPGSNDLVLTSDDLPKVGDVVTASGTLYNNKDFGAGYKYRVILEKAEFKP